MRQVKWLKPSPAMLVACVALGVALGGTGYAATTKLLPKNSVGTAQLKNKAVTKAKLAKGVIELDEVHWWSAVLRSMRSR